MKNWHKKITLILIGLLLAVHILPIVYAKAETDSKEIYYADQDYITLKVDQKQDQYRLSIESKNLGSLDWVGYVFRLKPEDFASQKDFKQKVIINRSFYPDEGQPVGLVYATAKSVYRYLDVLSTLIDFATKEIFGSAIIDTVNVPTNEPAIYLVRAYSGSWGKLLDEGEKSFVREKLTNGKISDGQALGLNLFAIILDTASLVVPFDKSISQDDLRKIAVAGLTEISHKFSQPDFIQGGANAKDFNQVVVGGSAAMLKEFLNILKDEAAKNFLKFATRSLQIAADTVIVLDKVSKGGKIADRIAQLLTLGTPLETSYLMVNDAVAKLAKEGSSLTPTDWKEYTSQKLNYSIKYPSNWFKLGDAGVATDEYFSNNKDIDAPLYMGKDGIWLTIRAEKSSTLYEKVFSEKTGSTFKDSSSYLITKLGDITIDGKSAVKFAREASPEVKAEGTEYGYEIVYAVQNGNSNYSITFLTLGGDKTTATKNFDTYELIATSFKSITPATSSAKVIKPWKLVSGDPTNTCTTPTYTGEIQVRGWYEFKKTYQEEQWVLHIADEDTKILPLYDYSQKINFNFNSAVVLINAPTELEQKLKKASKENPEVVTLRGYETYCEGGPVVSVQTPTVKSNTSAPAQNPQTSQSQSSEKVVRVSGDVWLKNNKEGTPPLGVIIGIADTDTSPRAWRSGSDNPDLHRGDSVKYLSERSKIANPLEKFPQSTRAVEVELSNGKKGWIVAEWSYKGNSMVLAEVISQSDLTKPISVEPIFPDIEGKWNGSWVAGEITGNFEINIGGGWWFYGQGSETTETGTVSFTISGSLFDNKIFFYKNYSDRQIYYEGSVSGNTADGTWQQSSWFASSSGTWSMARK